MPQYFFSHSYDVLPRCFRETTFLAHIRIESRGRIPRDLPHNKVSRSVRDVRRVRAVRNA